MVHFLTVINRSISISPRSLQEQPLLLHYRLQHQCCPAGIQPPCSSRPYGVIERFLRPAHPRRSGGWSPSPDLIAPRFVSQSSSHRRPPSGPALPEILFAAFSLVLPHAVQRRASFQIALACPALSSNPIKLSPGASWNSSGRPSPWGNKLPPRNSLAENFHPWQQTIALRAWKNPEA